MDSTKIMRYILLNLTLLMPFLLAATSLELLPSLSAYADAENEILYNAMHLFGSWYFLQNAMVQKRAWDNVIGMGLGLILLTNMYDFPLLHNICTGLTMAAALWGMIKYTSARTEDVNTLLAVLAGGSFAVGYFTEELSLFWGETLAIFFIYVNQSRRIWIKKDA